MKRHVPGRYWSTFGKLGVLLLLAAAAFAGWPAALAQDESHTLASEPDQVSEPGDESPVPEPPGHLPFTPWDDGPEAIPFDSLPAAEQAAVMEQAERSETNSGYEVSQKWSLYSHEMAAQAAAETARRLAGLVGTDDIGVTP
jgi:hypothetical protein